MMDLKNFTLDELLLSAIKSEVESKEVYDTLAGKVKNEFLGDKLRFIAGEEVKHRDYLEKLFRSNFPDREPVLPEISPVPFPEVNLPNGYVPASEIFGMAMEAEKAASDFYLALSEMFDRDQETQKALRYLSSMETGHYRMLEIEKQEIEREEDYDIEWEMMHVGP